MSPTSPSKWNKQPSQNAIVAAVASREERGSIIRPDPFLNPRLVRAVLITGLATLLATELGFLRARWLEATALDARQWGLCLIGAVVVAVVDETRKQVEPRSSN